MVLLLVMSAVLLTACGKSNDSTDSKKDSVTTTVKADAISYFDSIYKNVESNKIMVDRYKEYVGIKASDKYTIELLEKATKKDVQTLNSDLNKFRLTLASKMKYEVLSVKDGEKDEKLVTVLFNPPTLSNYSGTSFTVMNDLYLAIVQQLYPELSSTEQINKSLEFQGDNTTQAVMKNGDVWDISEFKKSASLYITTVMADKEGIPTSDIFIKKEIPFVKNKDGKYVPSINGEPLDSTDKEMLIGAVKELSEDVPSSMTFVEADKIREFDAKTKKYNNPDYDEVTGKYKGDK